MPYKSFDEKVWLLLRKIPKGRVATYKQIAIALGKPRAFRAVGNACSRNPFPGKVPCHRVVKSSGYLGGFAFGQAKKAKMLKAEGVSSRGGKIADLEKRLFKGKRI